MKSLDDHVNEFRMPVGKYKGCSLEEIGNLEYLDWYVKCDYSSTWQKKLVNKYIDDVSDHLKKEIDPDAVIQNTEMQNELKGGAWVGDDDNF